MEYLLQAESRKNWKMVLAACCAAAMHCWSCGEEERLELHQGRGRGSETLQPGTRVLQSAKLPGPARSDIVNLEVTAGSQAVKQAHFERSRETKSNAVH